MKSTPKAGSRSTPPRGVSVLGLSMVRNPSLYRHLGHRPPGARLEPGGEMKRLVGAFMLTAAGIAAGAAVQGGPHAEAAQNAQGQDVLPALLVEVRGLRAAMEQMASSGPRVQLALGRLQLQEQRVNNLLRRLETTRGSLAGAQREEEQSRQQFAAMEEMLKNPLPDGPQRGQVEQDMGHVKQM